MIKNKRQAFDLIGKIVTTSWNDSDDIRGLVTNVNLESKKREGDWFSIKILVLPLEKEEVDNDLRPSHQTSHNLWFLTAYPDQIKMVAENVGSLGESMIADLDIAVQAIVNHKK